MSDVVVREEAQAPMVEQPQQGGDSQLLALIQTIALNPELPIERLEFILRERERLEARQAELDFRRDHAAMQAELPEVPHDGKIKDGSGNVRSTYATFEQISRHCRQVWAKYGFSISHETVTKDGQMFVTGILSHRGGHERRDTMQLPFDKSGSKNEVQARGSSNQYGRRYTASNLLGIVTSKGEDDDANAAYERITEEQYHELREILDEPGQNEAQFLKWMRIDALHDLPAAKYNAAMSGLMQKRREVTDGT